ncbi:MAG: 4-(cytidine 5'-diphospho)-2-C-methyl-D-erythritol kinase [Burkholderiaceae bacterium]|nr:4-(cytidine 5'-diphospho)-2-C-methyl-D-erythritol kinase [Burkholderiaceae bacterium]
MALYDVPAPAKINLFLHVVGRRPDGYHLLQTVFRFVGLYDYLDFDLRPDGLIRREGGMGDVAEQDDLVVRAALALQQATGTPHGAQISYRKHIPAGGGMGGGSSNAASTLIALNRLWQTGLDRAQLMRIGASLGADVPIFIYGEPAFAQGIGDEFSPMALPSRAYLIAQPTQSVATAGVFSDPDLTRDSACVKMSVFTDWQTNSSANNCGNYTQLFGRNDLEPVVFAKYPKIQSAATWLQDQGLHVRMTGSGACFFAEFATVLQAKVYEQQIVGKIALRESGSAAEVEKIWVCPGLFEHPLQHWIRS